MTTNSLELHDNFQHAELVFALVAPVGLDYEQVCENLKSQLSEFGYTASTLKLSEQIPLLCEILAVDCEIDSSTECTRIESHMKAGNLLCRKFNEDCPPSERNALLAIAATSEIAAARRKNASNTGEKSALLNKAHILATLKRPEEVEYLRKVYGIGLHVVGIFGSEEERVRFLMRQRHLSEDDAKRLVDNDEDDKQAGGQRTGDAYHLADVFVDCGSGSHDWKREVGRYLDLIFSHPYKTPTPDEQSMFMAYSASLRSAQFGRQVGAAIANDRGDLLAIGCNEVPKPRGGQYWIGDRPDERDHEQGGDSNDREKNFILEQIMKALPEGLRDDRELREKLRRTSLFSITEYGRAVHAEMEALLSCARRGIPTQDMIIYTTTFPCHNCARHIIGAGIRKVVYIEPYPKSKTGKLHQDAVGLAEQNRNSAEGRLPFVPFVGVSPRKYAEIFTVKPMYGKSVDRKLKSSGDAINWQRSRTALRLAMLPLSYIEREALATARLADRIEAAGRGNIDDQGGGERHVERTIEGESRSSQARA